MSKMSLYDLPKDMLIKLICEVEANANKKYEMVKDLFRDVMLEFQCSEPLCQEFCMIRYDDDGDHDSDRIITSQNPSGIELVEISLYPCGSSYGNQDDGTKYKDKNGIQCIDCERWYCADHWRSESIFCKHCHV